MSPTQPVPVIVGVGQVLQRLEDPRQAAEPLEMMLAALEQAGRRRRRAEAPRARGFDLRDARRLALRGSRAGDRAPARRSARRERRHALRRQLLAGLRDRRGAPDPGRPARGRAGRRRGERPQRGTGAAPGRRAARERDARRPRSQGRRGQADLPRGRARARDEQRERRLRRDRQRDPLRAGREPRGPRGARRRAVGGLQRGRLRQSPRLDPQALHRAGDRPGLGRESDDLVSLHAAHERQLARGHGGGSAPLLAGDRPQRGRSRREARLPARRDGGQRQQLPLHARWSSTARPRCASREPARSSWPGRRIDADRALRSLQLLSLRRCEVAAAELGIPEGRPLTVTGGLTFGGGPLNSYALHAIARMAEVVRERPRLARGSCTATAAGSRSTPSGSTRAEPPAARLPLRESAAAGRCLPAARGADRLGGPGDARGLHRGAPEGRAAHRACGVPHGRRPPQLGDAATIPRCSRR